MIIFGGFRHYTYIDSSTKIPAADKKLYQRKYLCTKTIKGKQKGSTDTFTLFIEKGLNLLKKNNATLAYIVPMSVTSSDAMTALHGILEEKCASLKISSYSNRPKQIFDAACVRTSIIICEKTGTPIEHLYTTKLVRRSETNTIEDIIKNLKYVDSLKFKIPGRYPKIGSREEYGILEKMFLTGYKLMDYAGSDNKYSVYYRTAGGRYFNVITTYPTGSSQESPYPVKREYHYVIGAILSTSIFWLYQQVYTDGLHIKQSELTGFPMPDLWKADAALLKELAEVYASYLDEIESNVIVHQSTSYKVGSFKEYRIGKSKKTIDKLDDIVGLLYELSDDQIDFVKNYEIGVRMNDEKG